MKKLVLSLLLCASAFTANAATIVVQSGAPAVEIKTSNGAALLGGTVVLGFFRNYTTAMNPGIADSSTAVRQFITANFVPIGTPASDLDYGTASAANPLSLRPTATPGTTVAGAIENSTWLASSGSVLANSQQDGGLVRGTKIFMMIYNGATLDASSELGVFSASNWTLPASAAVNTLSMTLTQVDLTTEVYRGNLGSFVLAPIGIIPEPSSCLLSLLAGLGLISRRRR